MDQFEKKIKGRFQDATSSGGVDADELWGSIEKEMPAEQGDVKPSFFVWRLIGLLALLTMGLVYNVSENAENEIDQKGLISSVEKNKIESTGGVEVGETRSVEQDEIVENKKMEFGKIEKKNNENLISKIINENTFKSEKNIYSKSINTNIAEKENELIGEEKYSKKEVESIKKEENVFESNENKVFAEKENTITELKKENKIAQIKAVDFLNNKLIFVQSENKNETPVLRSIDPLSDKSINKGLDFGIFVGSYFIKNNFNAGQNAGEARAKLLNKEFQPESSYSVSAEAIYHLNKNLFVKSGITYSRSTEEFNYTHSWDTLVWENDIPGTKLIDAIATRRIKHHNKHTVISVPVLFGLQQQKGRFNFGINGGVGFNFIQSQIGRSLNAENEIVDFPNGETAVLPRPSFNMSYQLQPFLNYHFNEKWALQVRSDFQYHVYGKSDFYELKRGALFSGLSVGVVYGR